MNGIDGNGFSSSTDTSVLAERLQIDSGELKARARDPHAEIKTKIHRACIARLGAAFLNIEGSRARATCSRSRPGAAYARRYALQPERARTVRPADRG